MATKKLTPAQETTMLQGEDAVALAEAYAIRFSSDRTKAAFHALIA